MQTAQKHKQKLLSLLRVDKFEKQKIPTMICENRIFWGFCVPERHGLKRQKEARKAGLSSYFALQFMDVNARIGAAGKVAAKARFGRRQGKAGKRRKKPLKSLEKT